MPDVLFPNRIILKRSKIRNMRKYLLFLVVLVSIVSCKKQHHDDMHLKMTGTWVETTQGKDTIVFDAFISGQSFNLKRAIHPNIDYYDYTIKNNTIYTRSLVSSSLSTSPNFFKLDSQKQQFRIGNFYDNSKAYGAVLTFSKIL